MNDAPLKEAIGQLVRQQELEVAKALDAKIPNTRSVFPENFKVVVDGDIETIYYEDVPLLAMGPIEFIDAQTITRTFRRL